ncbi:MAG: type II toxin-antitoxin system VapC family toxin [Candidatus Geothermincolia bacterium]
MAGRGALILDTCALLWLTQGGGELSPEATRRIKTEREVYVSAITGFEIGVKHRQGKLTLPVPPQEWFRAVLAHHGLEVLPLELSICLGAAELPDIHRDPCDRIIIASALKHHFPVVTADPVFSRYGVTVLA